jgi:hypothetical protein
MRSGFGGTPAVGAAGPVFSVFDGVVVQAPSTADAAAIEKARRVRRGAAGFNGFSNGGSSCRGRCAL